MIRRSRLFPLLIVTVVGLILTSPTLAKAPGADRGLPNIVLILADDMGYGDPRCYNAESKVPTPNIDRLASGGMRFLDAHTPSSVCSPTRYGLLTGRYAWRTRLKKGVLDGYSPRLIEPGRMTLASMLKERGYQTVCVGKWHLGLGDDPKTDYARPLRPGPNAIGFDSYFGIPASLDMPPYVFVEDDHLVEAPTATVAASPMRRTGGPNEMWRGGPIAPGFRFVDVLPTLGKKAVSSIEDHAKADRSRPVFLYFAMAAPHTPWVPTAEFVGKTGVGYYGDFAAQVDSTVGQVLDALDRAGLADETLVIFTSDNGAHWLPADIARWEHRANGALRGQKADIWEGGHRVPFIVRWPGQVAAGSTSDQTICLTDVFSTLAAVVGVSPPDEAGEDSFSILPALRGEWKEPIRSAIVHHSSQGMFAIRQGPWKLALGLGSGGFTQPQHIEPSPGGPKDQLYNLADDPGETRDLYRDRPEIVARLTALLETYQSEGRSRPGNHR
jgi:arylsulfatase A-like enzyme